ncbi:16S rRNA (guanine(527)-N(7))-methyltransferase RsmG [Candidatus Synchoanobacter obligatus]|uniref:Ribosomal RNA small subunit methyltransferase G n=1 Tax=Candidatus Synchoanobacter obligatus TaxID=2919597 RepID=A0ABT1L4T6_9GAMM|nr:16S rRNA (guanine(527)-N(7))-methyltransferase RsmG [Candidatus Synchoanobacter obligatus]MCP8351735.1 16S rRNA (guanine(527)-N(7))-methyltransferase RsmG [Candidatus Synchoanobacter obligatus]
MNHFLKQHIEAMGIPYHDNQIEQLDSMLDFLGEWNQKHNLTRLKKKRDQEIYHVLDALSADPYFKESHVILDVGTGAGFPGIPLAIMNPDKQYHLVDSNGKKVAYLRALVQHLGLNNVTVYHNRVEQLPLAEVDAVTARAVADPEVVMSLTKHLNPNVYILYVGRHCPDTAGAKMIALSVPESDREHWLCYKENK